MKKLILTATMVLCSAAAGAQEPAKMVQTGGYGELIRASESMAAKHIQTISIRLPDVVQTGDVISIDYVRDGASVADSFMVTGILVKDGQCTLESRNKSSPGGVGSDVIRVPCKKLH